MAHVQRRLFALANAIAGPVLRQPLVQRLPGMHVCVVRYRGRRSGAPFTLDAWYRRTDDGVRIDVAMAQHKTWWRNFTARPHPIEVEIDGTRYVGTGLVGRSPPEKVWVDVRFDQPT